MKDAVILLLCAVALAQGINQDPSEAQQICQAKYDYDDVLIAHENCNQFYKCDHGVPVALTCYGQLLYNPYIEQCDWPENVDCGDRIIPDLSDSTPGVTVPETAPGNNWNPSEAPAICAAEDSVGVIVAHENCNQFYVCNGGKPITLICPPNLLFNPAKDQCDWPENVDCGNRVIPDPEENVSIFGVGKSDADNAPESVPGNNWNPSEAPAICAAEDSEGVLVAHENCNEFYICNGGHPIASICPPNLLFNPAKDQCDWSDNVDCGDRVIPEESDSTPGVTEPESDPGNNWNPSEAPAICAADKSEGVLVAHENCNQFYQCNGGIPIALICPPGLLFNPAIDQCDWPANVDCGDRVIPDPEDSVSIFGVGKSDADNAPESVPGNNWNPSEAPVICAADDSEGVLVAHENCNEFYICNGGQPIASICPPNLLFNPAKDQCDWSDNVDCGDRVIPEESDSTPGVTEPESDPGNNWNPSEAPAICAADKSEGVLVAHENCNQFYQCNGGNPIALICPPGLLFNPAKDQCDWPANVNCGDRVIPEPEESVSIFGVGKSDADNAPESVPGNNWNPSEAPAICAAEDSEGVLVAHENCNEFYICNGGHPIASICPPNLLFNPAKDQCDWSDNVDCGDRVIPEESDSTPGVTEPESDPGNNWDPSEAPAICAADKSEGVLVAHENCNQFYQCNGGNPIALICPPGLLFNPAVDQCDWPANVNCGDRVIPDPEESVSIFGVGKSDADNAPESVPGNNWNPSEAPAICAADDSEGVLVAHENCNQFYVCNGKVPIELSCPSGLLFNPAEDLCDWSDNVDCGNRVIPDESDSIPGVTEPESDPGNNWNPSEAPEICAADKSEGVLVAHENCNQFYQCNGGEPIALICPPGLLFNPAIDQCDWPFNVECGDRFIPDPESESSSS